MPNATPTPGFGVIKSGNTPPAICSGVPKFVAFAPIVACSNGTVLWQPAAGATSGTVSIKNPQNFPDAWVAFKLIGASPSSPCAAKGSLTFNIPPGTSNIMFTIYFPKKPAATGISIVWNANEIEPDCS